MSVDQAAAVGDVKVVDTLMALDNADYTEAALHNAISCDHFDVLKVLLTCGRPLKYRKAVLLKLVECGKTKFIDVWLSTGQETAFVRQLKINNEQD
jgi:hypothetical protein